MIKTNRSNIVEFLLQCQPGHPRTRDGWQVDHEGNPFILPGIGGITLNIQAGDSVFDWAGDHVEPGVSCTANTLKPLEHPNSSLQTYSCIGNKAKIITGDQKGKEGVVIGLHGGSEHIIIDFPRSVKENLNYDDKIIVFSKGQGLKFKDYPEIMLYNIDPDLLEKIKINETNTGILEVPVTTIIPPVCMGAGVGAAHSARGDYDIMTSDPETVKKYNIDKIRFGDFVALSDHDNRYGRTYRKGAVTIGIVVHSDCLKSGHGPGVTTIMTSKSSLIKPIINPEANIADLLKIGTHN
jgi:hypothetical protein